MSDKERLERIKDIHERAIFEHGDGDRKFELRDIVYILWQEYHTDWLIEQAEQTESFKKLHKTYLDRYVDAVGERNDFFEENDRLRRALEFYADDATYKTNVTDQWEPITPVSQDKGKKAKKALEGEQ